MKALMLKDAYLIWKNNKFVLGMCLLFSAIPLLNPDLAQRFNFFFFVYPCLLILNILLSLLSYDSKSRWEEYAMALPYSRVQLVTAKYLMGLLLAGGTLLLELTCQGLRMHLAGTFQWPVLLLMGSGLTLVALLPSSLCLPLLYFFGVEKGQLVYVWALVCLGAMLGVAVFALPEIPVSQLTGLTLPGFALGILLFALSWYISVRIYRNREL